MKRGSLSSAQRCVMEAETGPAHLGLVEEAVCGKKLEISSWTLSE